MYNTVDCATLLEVTKRAMQLYYFITYVIKCISISHQVPGVLRTATGKPGEVICRIAEEENAAMIVTGTRGMGKVRRTILGSVSDFLVHHAYCPVVVCRTRTRKASGSDGKKSRHSSGESFAASIRSRFSSGKSRSQSVSSETSEPGEEEIKEEKKEEKKVKEEEKKDEENKEN
jgi:hypothetical protein